MAFLSILSAVGSLFGHHNSQPSGGLLGTQYQNPASGAFGGYGGFGNLGNLPDASSQAIHDAQVLAAQQMIQNTQNGEQISYFTNAANMSMQQASAVSIINSKEEGLMLSIQTSQNNLLKQANDLVKS